MNLNEALGNEASFGISFDYSRVATDFFGSSTEYSVPIPFSPLGADYAMSYGSSLRPTAYGFDISWGSGASMVHMVTTKL